MTEIQVYPIEEFVDPEDIAQTRRGTPGEGGGRVPGRLAGYTYDGAAYCPACADETEIPTPDGEGTISIARFPAFETNETGCGVGVLAGTDEWDYPGASCHECHDALSTNVLVYREGPGHEHYSEE